MMMELPLVTVISLCYNTGKYTVEALECVRRQTYSNIQLIIIDDFSIDSSVQAIEDWIDKTKYPCIFIRKQSNGGIPAAFNTAIRLAKGEYITWISDDLWEDIRVEKIVSLFQRLPKSVGILFGNIRIIDSCGNFTGQSGPYKTLSDLRHPLSELIQSPEDGFTILPGWQVKEALFWKCFIPAPSVTLRRNVYDIIGPYDESLHIEDLDYWFRAADNFDFVYMSYYLANYRIHLSNFSSGRNENYFRSLETILERHRNTSKNLSSQTKRAIKRHIREEAYRIACALLKNDLRTLAMKYILRSYFPNFQMRANVLKETTRLLLYAVSSVVSKKLFQRIQ